MIQDIHIAQFFLLDLFQGKKNMKLKCKTSKGAMDEASQAFGSVSLFWRKKLSLLADLGVGGQCPKVVSLNGCGPGQRQETATIFCNLPVTIATRHLIER